MAPSKSIEPTVARNDPMPAGYVFVQKGSTYITANCRKQTRGANKTVFVVIDPAKKRQIGIRVPRSIHAAVCEAEKSTRSDRATAVEKKDASAARKFEQAILRLFPNVPTDAVPRIAKHALVKRSKRVARVGAMEEGKRVRLAVWAHVRHYWTDYDLLLRQNVPRESAREQVKGKMERIIKEWGGEQDVKGKNSNKGSGRPARRASVDAMAKTRDILSPRKKTFAKTEIMAKGTGRIGKPGGPGGPRTTGGGLETASARSRTARARADVGDQDDLADFIVLDSDEDTMFDDDDTDEMDWTPDEN